ncbi:MAG: response regulator/GGDEF domain protein [Capsulimonas sp.]|nr:response regulator/GGDEF domain protein [Capsulimonas sp.]
MITPRHANTDSIDTIFRQRLIFSAVFIGVLLLALVTPGISRTLRVAFDNGASVVAPLAALVWIARDLLAGRRKGRGQESKRFRAIRIACTMIALGALGDCIGEGIWAYYEQVLKEPPFPSVADIAYLTEYPLLLAGILLMPSRPVSATLRLRVLLDSMLIMTCAFTCSWYFVLGPTVLTSQASTLGTLLSAGYPIGDLILLFCVLILCVQERRTIPRSAGALMVLGMLSIVIADIVFAYQTLHETYVTGKVVDIFWPLAYLLIGLAATLLRSSSLSHDGLSPYDEDEAPKLQPADGAVWLALLPYALLPAIAGLVVYCIRGREPSMLEYGVYLGAALLVVLLLFRQIIAILDNARLNRKLHGAYQELQSAQDAIETRNTSLAAANARLESLAMTDGMTGLVNHRVFYERMTEACAGAARYRIPFALLLMDVDHFKSYNDTYGHPAGDTVLKEVAQLLEESARDTDVVARYGGEEFAMLLPLNDLEGARTMAERIRVSIECYAFAHRPITVSIGVSAFAVDRETPEALVSSADQALYEAKRAGRNRVVLARPKTGSAPEEMDRMSASLKEA